MAMSTKLLYGAMALLIIDGVTELALITSMVGWLHRRAGGDFIINNPNGGQFLLHGKPKHFWLDQGHTSNGAAGSAFIPVGLGGILALFLRHRQLKRNGSIHGFTSFLYNTWLWYTLVSAVYSLAALVFVFVVTYQHTHQSIDITVAAALNNEPYPNYVAYPDLTWTPQNWFPAVLELPLASSQDRSNIRMHLDIMRAWQWNIIPMTVLGFVVMALAFMDRMSQRQRENRFMGAQRLLAGKNSPQFHNV